MVNGESQSSTSPCLYKVENISYRYTEYAVISTLPGIPVPRQQEN